MPVDLKQLDWVTGTFKVGSEQENVLARCYIEMSAVRKLCEELQQAIDYECQASKASTLVENRHYHYGVADGLKNALRGLTRALATADEHFAAKETR